MIDNFPFVEPEKSELKKCKKSRECFISLAIMASSGGNDKVTEKVLAVQQMQDYIAVHLSEKITLCDLSCTAGYSPFYCARIFKELTGIILALFRMSLMSSPCLRKNT